MDIFMLSMLFIFRRSYIHLQNCGIYKKLAPVMYMSCCLLSWWTVFSMISFLPIYFRLSYFIIKALRVGYRFGCVCVCILALFEVFLSAKDLWLSMVVPKKCILWYVPSSPDLHNCNYFALHFVYSWKLFKSWYIPSWFSKICWKQR